MLGENTRTLNKPDVAIGQCMLAAMALAVSLNVMSAGMLDASQRTDGNGTIFQDRFELYRWLDWQIPWLLDGREGNGLSPRVVLEDEAGVAIWQHGPVDDYRVFSARSSDGGASWGEPVRLDSLEENARDPWIAMANGKAVAVWIQGPYSSDEYRIYAVYSQNAGESWSEAQRLDNVEGHARNPRVALTENGGFVVWEQGEPGADHERLFGRRFDADDASWGPVVRLDELEQRAMYPRVVAQGNRTVVAWSQGVNEWPDYQTDLYVRHSADGGETWSDPQQIDAHDAAARRPELAIGGERVLATWYQDPDNGNRYRIHAAVSSDGGANWSAPQPIEPDDGVSRSPYVALQADVAVITWRKRPDDDPSEWLTYVNHSVDGGMSWGDARQLSEGGEEAREAQVAMQGERAVVAWYQELASGDRRIHASHSWNGGRTWSAPQRFDGDGIGDGRTPHVAVSGDAVSVIWRQAGEEGFLANRVFHKRGEFIDLRED